MLPALSAKIERAKEQIQYLETEISAFFQTEPYSAVRNDDVESGEWFYALQIREQIPLRFSVIGGEITHDLRSCLDNLACHLIRANGGLVTSNSGFPVASAAKDYKSLVYSKVKGASAQAINIVEQIQAYLGGNDGLWKLHSLSVADKHFLPILIGSAYRSYAYDPTESMRAMGAEVKPMKWIITGVPKLKIPIQDGAEIHRYKKSPWLEAEQDFEFTFEVAFGQPEVVEGEPLIPTLTQFAGLVEQTVNLFNSFI